MGFEKIKLEDIQVDPFQRIGKEWMLISAKKEGVSNTMTASWGTMGVFWGRNVVTVGLRPQRYTREFLEAAEYFTLTFFDGQYKKALSYLGTVSGRDEDKITASGLHLTEVDGEPAFEEGTLVMVCKPLMKTRLDPDEFKEDWIDSDMYPHKDYHYMYTAEIVAVYRSV